MPQPNVTMTARKAGADIGIIDMQGDITGFAENTLMDAYAEAVADGAQAIVLNFSGVEYLNSSGIGLLVTLLIRIQRQGQRLLAFGLTSHYRQIFELTRLNDAIAIYEDEAAALEAVQAAAR